MKCSECNFCTFEEYNGGPNRYYCLHPVTIRGVGAQLICRTERHSRELKVKTSPKWCPYRQVCRVCGCTWDHACPGGCYWVEPNLCSKCMGKQAYNGISLKGDIVMEYLKVDCIEAVVRINETIVISTSESENFEKELEALLEKYRL